MPKARDERGDQTVAHSSDGPVPMPVGDGARPRHEHIRELPVSARPVAGSYWEHACLLRIAERRTDPDDFWCAPGRYAPNLAGIDPEQEKPERQL